MPTNPTNGIFESSFQFNPAVEANGTNGADGVDASSDTGNGLSASSSDSDGVVAQSLLGNGLSASAVDGTGTGVYAQSAGGIGVHAVGAGATAADPPLVAQAGILAEGGPNPGVAAIATTGTGVFALSESGAAVSAASGTGIGVSARSESGVGVHAVTGGEIHLPSVSQAAIVAEGGPNTGVAAFTESGIGVSATATNLGGIALQVNGKVEVQGNSAGFVPMAKGKTTLQVSNAAATANTLIFLTPLGDPKAFLWIGARSAGSFTIDASTALPAAVTIGFLIIN